MSISWNGTRKPRYYTPDDSPRFLEPGFEPRERESILPLLVALGFGVVVGLVAIARRIL